MTRFRRCKTLGENYSQAVSYTHLDADLSYIDQNTKVVFAGMDVTNERQKVQITVTKTDSETKNALELSLIHI